MIQWHALGMFLPSLFSGHLIRHFGAVRIVLVGVVANFAMIAIVLSGTGVLEYWSGLVLLGIGWNFMFVGGSTLLTEVYSVAEKGKVQGVNDFLVFGTNAAASLSSGLIYHWYGWRDHRLRVVPPLLAVFAMAFWLRMKRRAASGRFKVDRRAPGSTFGRKAGDQLLKSLRSVGVLACSRRLSGGGPIRWFNRMTGSFYQRGYDSVPPDQPDTGIIQDALCSHRMRRARRRLRHPYTGPGTWRRRRKREDAGNLRGRAAGCAPPT